MEKKKGRPFKKHFDVQEKQELYESYRKTGLNRKDAIEKVNQELS